MMLAEIEEGTTASASDPDWTGHFGISRQRAPAQGLQASGGRVTRAQLESLRATNALPHTLPYDQLAPYHVPFDELCGGTAVEGELAREPRLADQHSPQATA